MLESFLIMLQAWRQETATKVFPVNIVSFKSSFLHKTLPVDTLKNISDSDARRCYMKKNS